MGVFEQFPYTNFHDLNLDWIIKEIKNLLLKVENLEELQQDFDDLAAYVHDYFDNLDITPEVSAKIDELVADGTMAQVVAEVIDLKRSKNSNMHLQRLGRLLDRFGLENRNRVLYGQSCCYADGLYYTSGSTNSDTEQHVSVWNGTGQYVNHASYSTLGHGNDITAIGNYLAVATGLSDRAIGLIDRTTLALITKIIAPASVDVGSFYGVTTYGDDLLALGRRSDGKLALIKIVDFDNTPLFYEIAVITRPNNITPQTCCYYDGYVYLTYAQSNEVYKVDVNTGEIIAAFMIPDSDGFNPIGEVEAVFLMNDDIYLFTPTGMPEALTGVVTPVVAFAQIFKTDIVNMLTARVEGNYRPDQQYTLTLNENMTYEFNPFGTYSTIEEICEILNYRRNINAVYVSDATTGVFWAFGSSAYVYATGANNIFSEIYVTNSKLWFDRISSARIYTRRNSHVTFNACTLTGTLNLVESETKLLRCTINLTGLYVERSLLDIEATFSIALDASFTNATSSNSGNVFKFAGAYSDDVLKLAKNMNGLMIHVYRSVDLSTMVYTNAQIMDTTVITTTLANSKYAKLVYDNYTLRLLEVGDVSRLPLQIIVQSV